MAVLTRLSTSRGVLPFLFRSLRRCSEFAFDTDVSDDFGEATCSFSRRLRPVQPVPEDPLLLTPSQKGNIDLSVLQNCLVAVDKPVASLTFDLINQARHAMGARHYRIGHAGILDVMASGIVLLLFGNATKHLTKIARLEHEYVGALRLGHTTQTYDTLSPVTLSRPWEHLTGLSL